MTRRYPSHPIGRPRLPKPSPVGMFGSGTGWGIPFISHSICLTVGGVGRKPGLTRGGRVEARDIVCLIVSVDHDAVNGAPLARFMSGFREDVETAALLAAPAVAVTR